ncbi:hypothetical protein ACHHYP_09075 [Achlya hypogyna]|uniref:IPT/TIG domain-containing protein n=1 Tax=Achlya hypogyna TaxID=1202772 RepID=A0A1V9ZJP5_ACHHY|nr:hypothetical protein ACHHYP_09075 [Achlya hypogyna]
MLAANDTLLTPRRASRTAASFTIEGLSPASGPTRGGTEVAVIGSRFGGSFHTPRRATDVHLRSQVRPCDATVRFMLGKKILSQRPARLLNSKKLMCTTPPFLDPLLSTNWPTWGIVSILISLEGSPYVACAQTFQYYVPPHVHTIMPPTFPMVQPSTMPPLRMQLSVAETPQTIMTETEVSVLQRMTTSFPLLFRVRRGSPREEWIVPGVLEPSEATEIVYSVEFPPEAGLGLYSIDATWNGIDFDDDEPLTAQPSLWSDWLPHKQFEIFAPPVLRALTPTACYYAQGQTLRLDLSEWVAPGQEKSAHAMIRFEGVRQTAHSDDYTVLVPMAIGTTKVVTLMTPWFHEVGLHRISISINGGVHFTTYDKPHLLVYHKPSCEFLTPEYGISRGDTELSLRIAFVHPRVHEDHPLVPLEDTDIETSSPLWVRFVLESSRLLLATVPGTLSSCRQFVQCRTPPNTEVESFQYSQVEAAALELSLDGVLYFPLAPKKPFQFYAPPQLKSFSTTHAPTTGGTHLTIELWHSLPDCRLSRVRFRCPKTFAVKDVAAQTQKQTPTSVDCIVPPWPAIADDGDFALVVVEVTLNGVDYHTDTARFEPSTNEYFGGYRKCFLFYRQPRVLFVSPAYVPSTGGTQVVLHGDGLRNYGGPIQVAFSNGTSTRYVPGTVEDARVVCAAPPFPPGPCNVAIALNGQQFTGDWNGHGDCISTDSDSRIYYFDVPEFTALVPASGPLCGRTFVQIFGVGFFETGTVEVRFAAPEIEYEEVVPGVVTDGVLMCTTPRSPVEYSMQVSWSFSDRIFLGLEQKRKAIYTYA